MSELRRRLEAAVAGFDPELRPDDAVRRARRRQRNHRVMAGALALVVTVAGVAVAARQFSSAPPAGPGVNARDGVLVFASDRDSTEKGVRDLYSIRPDGTGLRRLTSTPDIDEAYPAVSPDGRTIAYVQIAGGQGFLRLVGIDGSQVDQPSAFPLLSSHSAISWSPDGRKLAYVPAGLTSCPATSPGEEPDCRPPSGIWINALQFHDGLKLLPEKVSCENDCYGHLDPAWSPDGRSIAFVSAEDGLNSFSRLLVVNLDTGVSAGLPPEGFPGVMSPAWSPSGREIAVQRDGEIVAVDDSGDVRKIWGQATGRVRDPSWSPDGTRIAFLTPQGGIRITSARDTSINKTAFNVADLGPTVTDLTWGPSPSGAPTPAPATPSQTSPSVDHCAPSPSRPSYLPWSEERKPARPSKEERSERDAVLIWFEDPELEYRGRYVSLATTYDPPLGGDPDEPFPRVPVRGVSGYLVWIGDPGVGDVAIIWVEHAGPCGSFQLSTGSRGLSEATAERLIRKVADSLMESS